MRYLLLMLAILAANVHAESEVIRLSEPVESGETYEVYGAPMPDKSQGLSLRAAIAHEQELAGEEVRVSTRIAKVCQKKGCFFVATEGDALARITFADYGFFIPTDSGGKQATLVGTLTRNSLTEEQAAHAAEDLGEQSGKAQMQQFEFAIVATSVLIND